jgi:MoxR-like ATPase
MLQAHACNRDFLLIGPKSSSKSLLINHFAHLLNYELITMHLYRDMTARDFLQRRNTKADGSTYWEDSPLIAAAKSGSLIVLEGLHWIPAPVLGCLSRLFQDREIVLPDNSKLYNNVTYQSIKSLTKCSDQELAERGIFPIHPAFRIISTVTTSNTAKQDTKIEWFNEEIAGMMDFLKVDPMSNNEEKHLLKSLSKVPDDVLNKIEEFSENFQALGHSKGHENVLSKSISLSTRLLLRICNRAAYPNSDLYSVIYNACLGPFLPQMVRSELHRLLEEAGISKTPPKQISILTSDDNVIFGDVSVPKYIPADGDLEAKTLIPHTSDKRGDSNKESEFFNNPGHARVMRDFALDFSMNEHLLLIGNQGVGKNKLTDRFLELLEYPREYIQLHRDTTVQSLLVQPVVENGRIVYKDSPLLKAVQKGRVLVVDEADKAPVYITSILKSLAETGEMEISTGRKIRRKALNANDIEIHPVRIG